MEQFTNKSEERARRSEMNILKSVPGATVDEHALEFAKDIVEKSELAEASLVSEVALERGGAIADEIMKNANLADVKEDKLTLSNAMREEEKKWRAVGKNDIAIRQYVLKVLLDAGGSLNQ